MSRVRLSLAGVMVALLILAGLLVSGAPLHAVRAQSPPPQPPHVTAFHRSGQTFITWSERGDLVGEQYRVYRHTQPISSANLDQARLLYQVAQGSGRFFADRYNVNGSGTWQARYVDRFVIEDGGRQLPAGTGLLVWTLDPEDFGGGDSGTGYYAVTTVGRNGVENVSDIGPANTAGPLAEMVGDPVPVEILTGAGGLGHVYTQFMDLRAWNPTFHAPHAANSYFGLDPDDPAVANAIQYAYTYSIGEPGPDNCGGAVPDELPAVVYLHGWAGNTYGPSTGASTYYCAFEIRPVDVSETWFFGFAREHDYRESSTPGAGDVIVNYTEHRVLRMVYDLLRDPELGPRVDPNRVYVYGGSMGGSGALAFALRYPNVFAAAYASEPMTDYSTSGDGGGVDWRTDVNWKWGSLDLNLPVVIDGPGDWADHLQAYNGTGTSTGLSTGVWDWQDHQANVQDRLADEMVPFGVAHGRNDDVIEWPTQGQPAYAAFNAGRRAWGGVVTDADHTWLGFQGLPPTIGQDPSLAPFAGFQVIRDESVPGLSNASRDLSLPPDSTGGYNQTLDWSASWNAWDGAPIDTPAQWRISLRTTDGSTQRVDVTPRRLQNFSITPGGSYAWENRRVSDNSLVSSGTVMAGANGLVTVAGFQVTSSGNRLVLEPATGSPPPSVTATPTPTSTAGGLPTATPTSTATAAATPTATPTATPAQSPISNPQSLVFQNGVSPDPSYAGTTDAIITAWSGNTYANLGGSSYLQVGETGDADEFRFLVRFELGGWLPADVEIEEAWLKLRAFDSGYDDGGHDVVAHRVVEEWVEGDGSDLFGDGRGQGVTWVTARPGAPWTNAGGDFAATELDRVSVAANPDGWYGWDVTAAVRGWADGSAPNYGFLLEPDGGPWLHHQFRSSEYAGPEQRPRLVIALRPACPTDVDGSGATNMFDVHGVTQWWHHADFMPAADVTGDGVVNIEDVMAVIAGLGEPCGGVPSPTPTATATPTPTPTATSTTTPTSASPTATPTAGGAGSVNFCPPYVDSALYRPRSNQITVGPDDDWMGTIGSAQPGTEILLEEGEYSLDQYAVIVDDEITVRGASGDRDTVLIRGMGYDVGSEGFMIIGANVALADLSMTGMRNHAISIKGEQGAQAPRIYNVHLYDIGTQHIKGTPGGIANGVVACSSIGYTPDGVQGDYIDGVDIHAAIDWVIRDNLFYNIWGDGSGCEVDIDCGTYISGPAVLMWNNARGTVVERNIFRNNFRNIAFGLGRGHEGGVIRNNFIYQTRPGDAGVELCAAYNAQVEHNTIILGGDYPGAIEAWNASGHLIRNNLITAPIWNRGNASFTAEGNITDAAMDDLVAPGDPHLSPDSQAIGAGVPAEVDHDIDGDPRVDRWDVGADQFVR